MDHEVKNMIARLCINHYEQGLPKRGKPQANREWTILAGIVQARPRHRPCRPNLPNPTRCIRQTQSVQQELYKGLVYEVVALGTGSKCVGRDKLSKSGDVIHDYHSEVVTRRAFLRYLYHQIKKSILKEESIFCDINTNGEFQLKPDVTFHFFTSQTPCGDASIFDTADSDSIQTTHDPMPNFERSNIEQSSCHKCLPLNCKFMEACTSTECSNRLGDNCDANVRSRKRKASPVRCELKSAKICSSEVVSNTDEDQETTDEISLTKEQCESIGFGENKRFEDHRTGAKCVPGDTQDPKDSSGYHAVGVLRLKPGRGSRSLSMSCSDKFAKWNILGCQGALLSHFLSHPIKFKSIVIGKCNFNEEAAKRALLKRIDGIHEKLSFAVHDSVSIYHSNVEFKHSKEYIVQNHIKALGKMSPCGSAIVWSAVPDCPLEVSVKGIKQGVTTKDVDQRNARCNICKSKLFETFKEIVALIKSENLPNSLKSNTLNTYWDYKQACVKYQDSWKRFLEYFPTWIRTPIEYSQFS
ncbi:tRNA-specific adenosine deaminase 1-like [Antedon mediterranea]|uniref:tRNA-specific adenosine deaminase 1-like n=1 Tax=Antedon mediterranea TaxID=105859 RepID=UPI003AF7C7CB